MWWLLEKPVWMTWMRRSLLNPPLAQIQIHSGPVHCEDPPGWTCQVYTQPDFSGYVLSVYHQAQGAQFRSGSEHHAASKCSWTSLTIKSCCEIPSTFKSIAKPTTIRPSSRVLTCSWDSVSELGLPQAWHEVGVNRLPQTPPVLSHQPKKYQCTQHMVTAIYLHTVQPSPTHTRKGECCTAILGPRAISDCGRQLVKLIFR